MNRQIFRTIGPGFLGCLMAVSIASAGNPHFVKATTSLTGGGWLIVSWKEVSVTQGTSMSYSLTANVEGAYACLDESNQVTGSEHFSGTVTADTMFVSGNGPIVASLMASELPSPTMFCDGQRVLACITYTDIVLADVTHGVTETLPTVSVNEHYGVLECP